MARTRTRVLGGGNTYVEIGISKTSKVTFLAQIQDNPGNVVGNPTPIHPLGEPYPVEIATGYAQGAGTLTLTVWSEWGRDGWVSAFMTPDSNEVPEIWEPFVTNNADNKGNQLDGYPVDLYEVLKAQRMNDGFINVSKVEKGADGNDLRIKRYQGCVITNISAGESVNISNMDHQVSITMMYTHITVVEA